MSDEGRLAAATQQRVADILDGLGGRTAIAARRIGGRKVGAATVGAASVQARADDVFPAAWLASLPIAVEVLRRADLGQFSLSEPIDIARMPPVDDSALGDSTLGDSALDDGALDDGALDDGALDDGALDDGALGDGALVDGVADGKPTIGDVCERMLGVNDSAAANVLLDYVGLGEINETLSRLKLPHTKLARQLTTDRAAVARRENETSADDMLTLLALLHGRALPGSRRLLAMLPTQAAPTASAASPASAASAASAALWAPAEAQLAHGGGAQGDLVHDAGLLTGPGGVCAYCILTAEQPDVAAAQAAIGETLRLLWDDWRLG